MHIIIDNVMSQVSFGGKEYLMKVDFMKELQEYMTIKVNNHFWAVKFARKKNPNSGWTGTHCFVTAKGKFATGFLELVIRFFKEEYDLSITVDDRRRNLPIFNRELDTTTPDYTLAPFQVDCVNAFNYSLDIDGQKLYYPRGVLKAAPNSGKTGIFGVMVKNVINAKALLLVDSQDIFEQHIDFYKRMFPNLGLVGRVGKKYICDINPEFTIAMVDSLSSRLDKDMNIAKYLANDVNILGVDECHRFATKTAQNVIANTNAGMRIFMSGTPFDMDDKVSRFKIVGMSGEARKVVPKKWLMDNGYSMRPVINIYKCADVLIGKKSYDEEYRELIMFSVKRAKMIADIIAERKGRKILVNFDQIKHGEFMYDLFMQEYPNLAHLAEIVHGEDPERRAKIAAFKDSTIMILFGSRIMSTGINIKDIHTIVNSVGEKAVVNISQFMGRGERLDGIHTEYEWIDFYDVGAKIVAKHSRNRIAFYRKEGFEPNFQYDANKNGSPKLKKAIRK